MKKYQKKHHSDDFFGTLTLKKLNFELSFETQLRMRSMTLTTFSLEN